MRLRTFGLILLLLGAIDPSPAHAQATPAVRHPRRIVLELGPGTPRPGFGPAQRPHAAPGRLASSGLPALDAVHAIHRPIVYEPMFPGADRAPGVAGGEDLTRFYQLELPEGAALDQALADYAAVPGVVSAEAVPLLPLSYVPNDPMRLDQYYLGQPNDHDSDVFEAWDLFRGDTTIVVAIIDTGVLYTHEDLGGPPPSTAGNIAHNWVEMGGSAGVDDDGNGFVDDFRGWDFVSGASGVPGEDLHLPDNDPSDFAGHGTWCAGIAGATTDNGIGVAGVGFRTHVLPLRAGWKDTPENSGWIDAGFAAQSIAYASHNGAKVISCSFGTVNVAVFVAAVNDAIARGVTICDAAGNGNLPGPQYYLAQRGDCIDVAAVDWNDVRSGFSNYGAWVDVAAAGSGVQNLWSTAYVGHYVSASGTSASTPVVAGAIALYQGYRRSLGLPLETPARILLRIRDTGDDLDALNPAYAGLLGNRLNVRRLLTDPPTSWLNAGTGGFTTAPALVDLDGDGDEEVVIGGTDSRVVAVTGATGDTLPGFPVVLQGQVHTSPVAWDVDLDGAPEILVATTMGRVYAIEGNGTFVPGWPVVLGGDLRAGPAVADLDPANPGFELCLASSSGSVWVLDRGGAIRPGWPRSARAAIYAIPALHDFDGDGAAEIVVGSEDSTLHVFRGDGSPYPGWPVAMPDVVRSSAAIGDLDQDGIADIVVGCSDQKVHAFKRDGTPVAGWPVAVLGGVVSSPALADLVGNDGILDVAVASNGPRLYVLDATGTVAPGWPQTIGGQVLGSVLVADVDGDATLDVVAGATDRTINIFSAAGVRKPGWPRIYEGSILGTPSIGDPDGDGRVEIVFGTETRRLRAVDMGPGTWNAAHAPWPTAHRDYLRRGSVAPSLVDIPRARSAGPTRLALAAFPNPSTSAVRLVLTRPAGLAPATRRPRDAVRIFDVSGRLVRTLLLPDDDEGDAAVLWDGASENGRAVAPGLYFARARWGTLETTERLVRLGGTHP